MDVETRTLYLRARDTSYTPTILARSLKLTPENMVGATTPLTANSQFIQAGKTHMHRLLAGTLTSICRRWWRPRWRTHPGVHSSGNSHFPPRQRQKSGSICTWPTSVSLYFQWETNKYGLGNDWQQHVARNPVEITPCWRGSCWDEVYWYRYVGWAGVANDCEVFLTFRMRVLTFYYPGKRFALNLLKTRAGFIS